jgi:hypothetical protein
LPHCTGSTPPKIPSSSLPPIGRIGPATWGDPARWIRSNLAFMFMRSEAGWAATWALSPAPVPCPAGIGLGRSGQRQLAKTPMPQPSPGGSFSVPALQKVNHCPRLDHLYSRLADGRAAPICAHGSHRQLQVFARCGGAPRRHLPPRWRRHNSLPPGESKLDRTVVH